MHDENHRAVRSGCLKPKMTPHTVPSKIAALLMIIFNDFERSFCSRVSCSKCCATSEGWEHSSYRIWFV